MRVDVDVDAAALTRLVTRPVLPVGWRHEKPQTVAWRTYRRARALAQLIEAIGRAKELGLSSDELGAAIKAVNWGGGDALA